MRRILLAGFVLTLALADAAAQNNPRKERFLQLNPGYQKRAGASYEVNNLEGSVRSMVPAVDSPKLKDGDARAILREFIYDYLDAYVEAGGEMNRAEHVRALAKIDKRVSDLVDDKDAYQRYLRWRKTTPRAQNPLQFLFVLEIPVAFRVPGPLAKEGWTVEVIDEVPVLEAFKGYLGVAPDQVLRFSNPTLGKVVGKGDKVDAVNPWLMLVVYPSGRAKEALASHQAPLGPWGTAPPKGQPELPPLEVFWQTRGYLILGAEGAFAKEQARLATALKLQMQDR